MVYLKYVVDIIVVKMACAFFCENQKPVVGGSRIPTDKCNRLLDRSVHERFSQHLKRKSIPNFAFYKIARSPNRIYNPSCFLFVEPYRILRKVLV